MMREGVEGRRDEGGRRGDGALRVAQGVGRKERQGSRVLGLLFL
jgi:hypothetical protein